MKRIDLCKYVTTRSSRRYMYGNPHQIVLAGFQQGQRVAKELNMKCLGGENVLLIVPDEFGMADIKFLSGLLRPLIKIQGMDDTVMNIVTTNDNMRESLSTFWDAERVRVKEVEAKKLKEAGRGQWAKPGLFFIPDIGTMVRLKNDWTFRLYEESRNRDLMKAIGLTYAYSYRSDKREVYDVTFKAGTILKVDRIYIRKGVGTYSSLTFNVQKGKSSIVSHNKKEHIFKTKGARFWAKLSDVNKMVVEVDTSTLAEN